MDASPGTCGKAASAAPGASGEALTAADAAVDGTAAAPHAPCAIGAAERAWLRLVFGGPVSLWIPLARLVGVVVERDVAVDERRLAHAEAEAAEAARRFPAGLIAVTVGVAGLLLWLPAERAIVEPYSGMLFERIAIGLKAGGASFWTAMVVTSAILMVASLGVGLLNALVFGGVPLYFLRRCTCSAAPAVAIAIALGDAAIDGPHAGAYPRVAYAAERILHPRGR